MSKVSSLNQFFSEIQCGFRCYNMGRRIYPLEQQTFIDLENTQIPCKTPFLQYGWFAIVFFKNDKSSKNRENQEHHVWFLKLPLDEQAKLNLAARDDFLRRLFEVLGDYLGNTTSSSSDKLLSLESAMKDNPYGFQPKPEQLANFHAIVQKHLSLPASSFYPAIQTYLLDEKKFKQWNELGLQGFADITARLNESYSQESSKKESLTNEHLISEVISKLPVEPYQVLASCLENHVISKHTTQVIYDRLLDDLKINDNSTLAVQSCIAAIRASSQSSNQLLQIQILRKILTHDSDSGISSDIEILATMTGRCWEVIIHPEVLPHYLESLAMAETLNKGAFKAILSDLMFIPGMRTAILQAFRSSDRSQQLTQAIGTFFKTI